VALIFGWGDQEWKDGSDFAWACGCDAKPTAEQKTAWQQSRAIVSKRLCEHLRIPLTKEDAQHPWTKLPNFGGTVAFLLSYPWEDDPGIDLDVITGHHSEYYEDPDPNAIARDTEEPVPL